MASRRDFLVTGAGGVLATSAVFTSGGGAEVSQANGAQSIRESEVQPSNVRAFNGPYQGDYLNQVAFPLGGFGAGMICLEGTGALTKFSLHNHPDLTNEPLVFAALAVRGAKRVTRVLEGPIPLWKLRPQFFGDGWPVNCWGLPRFRQVEFAARFPFATIHLRDEEMPLEVELTGWSPFSPGDADNASLPVVGLEYAFTNTSAVPVDAVFSFNSANFMSSNWEEPSASALDRVLPTSGGFILYGAGTKNRPWDEGYFAAWVDDPSAIVNHAWFRAEFISQSIRMIWNDIENGECIAREPLRKAASPGGSLFVPFTLAPGQTKKIVLRAAWYVPKSGLYKPTFEIKQGQVVSLELPANAKKYQPWYAGRFSSINEIIHYWQNQYEVLREASGKFSQTFYDSTLPPEAVEAVAANLSILKSPTILRQIDGRLWGFEGCAETEGLADWGTDAVWNYAQAIAHLFPDLERSSREIEFGLLQNADGKLQDGIPTLPIRQLDATEKKEFADPEGQLGPIIKAFREWRISGDTAWLHRWWPHIRAATNYAIKTWDPERAGWLIEPHGCNYDTFLWGADGMCTSVYLAALKAVILMGETLGEPVEEYSQLLQRGTRLTEDKLFNGEYFIQRVQWKNLRDPFASTPFETLKNKVIFPPSPEGIALVAKEGPTNQIGDGCFADGVYGTWLSLVCGIDEVLDSRKVSSHLTAVYRHNFKADLSDNVNMYRASFACGKEAGMVSCTWPRGDRPSLPFEDGQETWTGIEYEIASHLIALGNVDEGLDIVRATRRRYDGRVRNPFDEVEWGHWYCRALSSYALLQAFSGARFDAVDKILYLKPVIKGDFRCFLSTATGYGTVGVKNGQPFVEVVKGNIPYTKIEYTAA